MCVREGDDHVFTVEPASSAQTTIDWVHRILKEERDIVIASRFKFATQKSELAGTIRGSYFVIKNEY